MVLRALLKERCTTRTGASGQKGADGQADGRTGGRGRRSREADGGGYVGRTSGQGQTVGKQSDRWIVGGPAHGLANGRTRGPTGGRVGGQADWWPSGLGRMVADGFPKGKTPKLTRQLTWRLEIQHGCPRVIVQLRHLSPPSR